MMAFIHLICGNNKGSINYRVGFEIPSLNYRVGGIEKSKQK